MVTGAKIIAGDADYCLAVKWNQPTLYDRMDAFFSPLFDNNFEGAKVRRHFQRKTTHGREVNRHNFICPVPKHLPDRARWKNLRAIDAVVTMSHRNGRKTSEIRCDILNRYLYGEGFATNVRAQTGRSRITDIGNST